MLVTKLLLYRIVGTEISKTHYHSSITASWLIFVDTCECCFIKGFIDPKFSLLLSMTSSL